jgi:hypothetical protein
VLLYHSRFGKASDGAFLKNELFPSSSKGRDGVHLLRRQWEMELK